MQNRFMKMTRSVVQTTFALLLLVGAALFSAEPSTQIEPGKVEVRGLIGSVSYFTAGGAPMPVRTGIVIPIGASVQTAPGASVDLILGHNAGVARLLQNSTLAVEKF